MANIVVNNSAELNAALKIVKGGETILLRDTGTDYSLSAYKLELPSMVTIKSEDPSNPVTFKNINLNIAKNLHIDNVVLDAKGDGTGDLGIGQGDNIIVSNSTFIGGAIGEWGVTEGAVQGEGGISVRNSNNITLLNNTLKNNTFAVNVHESDNVKVLGNDISQFQGDGIRLSGNKDVLIEGNHIHNALGSRNDLNHDDLIQMWAVLETRASENITIRGNFLDGGNGSTPQAIFMRNEDVDTRGYGTDRYFKNIVIEDNIIHNNHYHGITIPESNGVKIRNNTIVNNDLGENPTMRPSININDKAMNVEIANNIVSKVNAPSSVIKTNNFILEYNNPDSPNYVGNIFVDAESGGTKEINAFKILPDSAASSTGVGSSLSQYSPTPDDVTAVYRAKSVGGSESTFMFDASLSAAKMGALTNKNAVFTWDFGDGTKATGMMATHTFKDFDRQKVTLTVTTPDGKSDSYTSDVVNKNPVFLNMNFEGDTIQDLSTYKTVLTADEKFLTQGVNGNGFNIKNSQYIDIARGQEQLYNLKQFSVEFDFKKTALQGGNGQILGINKSWGLVLNKDNSLSFNMTDSAGKAITLSTAANALDNNWHNVGLSYDSIGGKVQLYVDKILVGETDAGSSSKSLESWGLAVGAYWGGSVDGVIDNLVMTSDPIGKAAADPIGKAAAEANTETLYGTDENNFFRHMVKYDAVFGLGGDDHIRGAKNIYGGDGNDKLFANGKGSTVFGGDGDDMVIGYGGNDILHGGKGNDKIIGGAGNDTIYFDAEDKSVNGGLGNDTAIYTDAGFLDYRHIHIETLDVKNNLQNTVKIDFNDVLQSDNDILFVTGDTDDVVQLMGKFSKLGDVTVDGQDYNEYTAMRGGTSVKVVISDLIAVDIF